MILSVEFELVSKLAGNDRVFTNDLTGFVKDSVWTHLGRNQLLSNKVGTDNSQSKHTCPHGQATGSDDLFSRSQDNFLGVIRISLAVSIGLFVSRLRVAAQGSDPSASGLQTCFLHSPHLATPTDGTCHAAASRSQGNSSASTSQSFLSETTLDTTKHFTRLMSSSNNHPTGFLDAKDAAALDQELMSTPGFTLEQLMELAGLSVAEAVYHVLSSPLQDQQLPSSSSSSSKDGPIVVVCGPGNNGGDGLVAARHLVHFGFPCVVVYPKPTNHTHYHQLVHQCKDLDIPIRSDMPDLSNAVAIVDAIFGFSFHGSPREPFQTILQQIMQAQQLFKIPVISVDVPSGWNVDEGDVLQSGFEPDVLVSLTAPKHSARQHKGRHFVGGRFLPPNLAAKYHISMPPYPGVSQVMELLPPEESCAAGNDTSET
eukprot:Nitzschia sp. Nitz4//scaffold17_size182527//58748//60533//NITZ4_001844-RA/size182527-snap-gene-0.291-mRNA-1//-1//CDS//3329539310//7068//frame0